MWQLTMLKICCYFVGYTKLAALKFSGRFCTWLVRSDIKGDQHDRKQAIQSDCLLDVREKDPEA